MNETVIVEGRVRAHIRINGANDAADFVSKLNSDGSVNYYIIEDENGVKRCNARNLYGVMYAMTDYADEMYLVNTTVDGEFPTFINDFRVIA